MSGTDIPVEVITDLGEDIGLIIAIDVSDGEIVNGFPVGSYLCAASERAITVVVPIPKDSVGRGAEEVRRGPRLIPAGPLNAGGTTEIRGHSLIRVVRDELADQPSVVSAHVGLAGTEAEPVLVTTVRLESGTDLTAVLSTMEQTVLADARTSLDDPTLRAVVIADWSLPRRRLD